MPKPVHALAPLAPLALLVAATAGAQSLPPIRPLGAVTARAHDSLGVVAAVRQLPGGRVLVNDPLTRRVLLYDSTLTRLALVADSTSATANAYGGRMGGLVPYRADSTLFVDPVSLSMLVIDPSGKVGRVMSVPRAQDAPFLTNGPSGTPGFDAAGRLVYRPNNRFSFTGGPPGSPGFTMPPQPDSAPIVRVDLATRRVDTAAFVKIQKLTLNVSQDANGRTTMTSEINPLPVVDEWAVLPDGAVAIVRGRDYHVDFIDADGTRRSAAKVPFEWQRLSDEDKVAFIDSVKAQRARMQASGAPGVPGGMNVVTSERGPGGPGGPGGAGAPAPDGGGMMRIVIGGPGAPGAAPGGPGRTGAAPPMPQLNFVAPSELPDYKPPFLPGAVRADAEGNLWIRTIPTKQIPGGPVYDVVSRRGELVDRVQLPVGRAIAGFGPGGVVYLTGRDASGATLERARVR